MTEERLDLTWLSDSYGQQMMLRNGPNLTLKEALIGTYVLNPSAPPDEKYEVKLKDKSTIGSYPTIDRARQALEEYYRTKLAKK